MARLSTCRGKSEGGVQGWWNSRHDRRGWRCHWWDWNLQDRHGGWSRRPALRSCVCLAAQCQECATIEQGREGASSSLYNFQQWHCLQHKACQQLELPQGFSSGRLCSVAETVSTFWFWKRMSGMSSWVFLESLSCMWFFYAHWIIHMNLGISLLFYAYIYFPCTS